MSMKSEIRNIWDRPKPRYGSMEINFIRQFIHQYSRLGCSALPENCPEDIDWNELRALLLEYRIFSPFFLYL